MRIVYRTKNFVLEKTLKELFEKKIKPFERFKSVLKQEDKIFFEIERLKKPLRAGEILRLEAQIKLPSKNIKIETFGDNLRVLIDEIKEKLEREIVEYKEKIISKR
jgi:ribosomal subunit interface protein